MNKYFPKFSTVHTKCQLFDNVIKDTFGQEKVRIRTTWTESQRIDREKLKLNRHCCLLHCEDDFREVEEVVEHDSTDVSEREDRRKYHQQTCKSTSVYSSIRDS